MKKLSRSPLTNNNGFVLPMVLFTISLFFILITANINSYRNEVHMSEVHLERLKIHTILQMSQQSVAEDFHDPSSIPKTIKYTFPEGEATIRTSLIQEDILEILTKVKTNRHATHTYTHYMKTVEVE